MILCLPAVYAETRINEVMYNPVGDDNNKEFVEIYSDELFNFTNFIVADSSSNDTLMLLQLYSSNYSLIVEGGFNYTSINASIYSAGASIGNNLGNTVDEIHIYYPNGTLISFINYTNIAEEGSTLEYCSGIFNQSKAVGGTPAMENSCVFSGANITNATEDEINQTNQTDYNLCDISITIWTEKELYENGEAISFKPILSNDSVEFEINYWADDVFNQTAKQKLTTANTDKKTFTPKIDEQDMAFILKVNLTAMSCNDSNTTNNYNEKLVVVRNTVYEKEDESSLSIEEISLGSDNKARFGEAIKATVVAYKGDTDKTALEIYAEKDGEKVSETTKANLYNKFTAYELSMPLQLKPNCDGSYKNGTYSIIVKGLGIKAEKAFEISGITSSLCKEITVEKTITEKCKKEECKCNTTAKTSESTKTTQAKAKQETSKAEQKQNTTSNATPLITGFAAKNETVVYESKSQKSKNIVPYFIIAMLAVLCIILARGKQKR